MTYEYLDGTLCVDSVPLSNIAADFGTPLYVYSWESIRTSFLSMQANAERINGHVYYAIKANSNLSILHRLAELGAGFDIVSSGELERVIAAGGDPSKVFFSGVGKSASEISFAIKLQVKAISVESESELRRVREISKNLGIPTNVVLRLNPDIPIDTHPYITTGLRENKFGMPESQVERLYREYAGDPMLNLRGLSCHLGSQIAESQPYLDAVNRVLDLRSRLQNDGLKVEVLNLGGGFGVRYGNEQMFDFEEYVVKLEGLGLDSELEIGFEPGRSIVASSGVLLTRIEYLKPAVERDYKNFVVVDAAMNDLLRPSLYQAEHLIEPVVDRGESKEGQKWDVVGPVCESGDFLGKDRAFNVARRRFAGY